MSNSIAAVYHYFEKDQIYKDNLIYFLSVGILSNVDYYIVISGECSINLPNKPNLFYLRTENWNGDFGGYIKFVRSEPSARYAYYLFINSSVRGPFLPAYAGPDWTLPFLRRLQGGTHLVGTSINTMPDASALSSDFEAIYGYGESFAHVQTTAYAITAEAFKYLRSIGFYDVRDELTKHQLIIRYELRMSLEVLKNRWGISCILPIYDRIDYRNRFCAPLNFSSKNGDLLHRWGFYGRTLHPTELIFIKTNRDLMTATSLASVTFTALNRMHSPATFSEGEALRIKAYEASLASYRLKVKWLRLLHFIGLRRIFLKCLRKL